jgi:uncharacterized protein (DUF1330 family)
MAAYIVVDTRINNPNEYEEYKALARPIVEAFGGTYLARGGKTLVVENDLWSPTRIVLLEFPDFEAAQRFAESDEYGPVAALRHQHADSNVIIIEGT